MKQYKTIFICQDGTAITLLNDSVYSSCVFNLYCRLHFCQHSGMFNLPFGIMLFMSDSFQINKMFY